jgi:hypothetical protein
LVHKPPIVYSRIEMCPGTEKINEEMNTSNIDEGQYLNSLEKNNTTVPHSRTFSNATKTKMMKLENIDGMNFIY